MHKNPFNVIIGDCAVSQSPKTWLSDKRVNEYFHKYNRMPLVDGSLHQHLLQSVPAEERLDRPDILHLGLLTVLGYQTIYPQMMVYFGINQNLFKIKKGTRIPRSQKRFYGILENLFEEKQSEFFKKLDGDIIGLLEGAIALSSRGKPINPSTINSSNTFVFGGFSKGDFTSENFKKLQKYSLVSTKLDLWTSISMFLNL